MTSIFDRVRLELIFKQMGDHRAYPYSKFKPLPLRPHEFMPPPRRPVVLQRIALQN